MKSNRFQIEAVVEKRLLPVNARPGERGSRRAPAGLPPLDDSDPVAPFGQPVRLERSHRSGTHHNHIRG